MSKNSQEQEEKQLSPLHKLLGFAMKAKDIIIHTAKTQNDVFIEKVREKGRIRNINKNGCVSQGQGKVIQEQEGSSSKDKTINHCEINDNNITEISTKKQELLSFFKKSKAAVNMKAANAFSTLFQSLKKQREQREEKKKKDSLEGKIERGKDRDGSKSSNSKIETVDTQGKIGNHSEGVKQEISKKYEEDKLVLAEEQKNSKEQLQQKQQQSEHQSSKKQQGNKSKNEDKVEQFKKQQELPDAGIERQFVKDNKNQVEKQLFKEDVRKINTPGNTVGQNNLENIQHEDNKDYERELSNDENNKDNQYLKGDKQMNRRQNDSMEYKKQQKDSDYHNDKVDQEELEENRQDIQQYDNQLEQDEDRVIYMDKKSNNKQIIQLKGQQLEEQEQQSEEEEQFIDNDNDDDEIQREEKIREIARRKRQLEMQLLEVNQELISIKANDKQTKKFKLLDKQKDVGLKQQQNSIPIKEKNQVKAMIEISDNKKAREDAVILVRRMNAERKRKEKAFLDRLTHVKGKITEEMLLQREEQYMQLSIAQEQERKNLVIARMQEQELKKIENQRLRDASKNFVKELITAGPREGQISSHYVERLHKIEINAEKSLMQLKEQEKSRLPLLQQRKRELYNIRSLAVSIPVDEGNQRNQQRNQQLQQQLQQDSSTQIINNDENESDVQEGQSSEELQQQSVQSQQYRRLQGQHQQQINYQDPSGSSQNARSRKYSKEPSNNYSQNPPEQEQLSNSNYALYSENSNRNQGYGKNNNNKQVGTYHNIKHRIIIPANSNKAIRTDDGLLPIVQRQRIQEEPNNSEYEQLQQNNSKIQRNGISSGMRPQRSLKISSNEKKRADRQMNNSKEPKLQARSQNTQDARIVQQKQEQPYRGEYNQQQNDNSYDDVNGYAEDNQQQ